MSLLILYNKECTAYPSTETVTSMPVKMIKFLSIFNFNMIVFCPIPNVEGPIYKKKSLPVGFIYFVSKFQILLILVTIQTCHI